MPYLLKEDYICQDETWVVPVARDQKFTVNVYGGGGSGSYNPDNVCSGGGGGSGYTDSAELTLNPGDRIEIEIGKGGAGKGGYNITDFTDYMIGQSGGITKFGDYLSAAGGAGGQYDEGGIGGRKGGNAGEDSEGGGHGGHGVTGTVFGAEFRSGGGGVAMDGVGRGGSADVAMGDAGVAAGGAGCHIVEPLSSSEDRLYKHIGAGGPGLCIIRYYYEVG